MKSSGSVSVLQDFHLSFFLFVPVVLRLASSFSAPIAQNVVNLSAVMYVGVIGNFRDGVEHDWLCHVQ